MQMKTFEQEYQIMEEQRKVQRKVKRTVFEKMTFVPNQSVQETNTQQLSPNKIDVRDWAG